MKESQVLNHTTGLEMTDSNKRRFATPEVLTDSTPFYGSTAGKWHQALTGNWEEKMLELKKRVEELKKANKAISLPSEGEDLASFYKAKVSKERNS
jgi:dTDP-4-dehydrorhamnose reductase